MTGSLWTAYTCIDRILVLERLGKEDPKLVERVNALLRNRVGSYALRIEYAKGVGITLFCRDLSLVPTSYKHAARVIKELDAHGNVLRTIDKRNTNERKESGQQPS